MNYKRLWLIWIMVCLTALTACSQPQMLKVKQEDVADLSMPGLITNDHAQLELILQQMREMDEGVDQWSLFQAKQDAQGNLDTILRSYAYLIATRTEGRTTKITGCVDLRKIDATSTQGDRVPRFSVSPSGRYVVVFRSDWTVQPVPKYAVYFFDLLAGTAKEIGQSNGSLVRAPAWSEDEKTLAYSEWKAKTITVYQPDTARKRTLSFDTDQINNLFVTGKGDIVIDGERGEYTLPAADNYRAKQLPFKGQILGAQGTGLYYLEQGSLYGYDGQQSSKVKDLGTVKDVYLYRAPPYIKTEQGIWVQPLDGSKGYQYPNYEEAIFSPGGSKAAVEGPGGPRVVSHDGALNKMIGEPFIGLGYWSLWSDDNHIVKVERSLIVEQGRLADFKLTRLDIVSSKQEVLLEPMAKNH